MFASKISTPSGMCFPRIRETGFLLLKQYFNCGSFYPYKEREIVQNEYVELFDRGMALIPH